MEKITFLSLVSVFRLVLISKINHRVIKKILKGKFMQRYNSSECLVGKRCVFFVKRKYTELNLLSNRASAPAKSQHLCD